MDLFTIKCFLRIVEVGSLSKAATDLNITQPAISMQLKKLENELDVKLIERDTHNFYLTEEGQMARETFLSMLGSYKNLEWQLQQRKNEQKHLRIGYHGPSNWANIQSLFISFLQENPNVQIHIYSAELEELKKMVIQGDIDIAFFLQPGENTEEELVSTKLFSELGCFAMNKNHRLATYPELSKEDVYNEHIYMNSGGKKSCNQENNHFIAAGLQLSNISFVNGILATIAMAMAHEGLAILPRSFKLLDRPDIVYVNHTIPDLAVTFYAVQRIDNKREECINFMNATKRFMWPSF